MGCKTLKYQTTSALNGFNPFLRVVYDKNSSTSKKSIDYFPFGSLMPGRSNPLNMVDAGGHRYGFQGQELDDEIKGVRGSSVNYKFRMHDPRVGRFFAVDPLAADYPHNSPYAFSENNVIHAIELEGLEKVPLNEIWDISDPYTTASANYVSDLGGAGITLGAFKVATINDVAVRLYEIQDGPNKGNYFGVTFESSSAAMSGEGMYEWRYVVGKNLVSDNWNSGELGAVSKGNLIDAYGDDYEFSSTLTGVNFMNKYGVGEYSNESGEWISGSLDELWDAQIQNLKDAWTDPMNFLPSPIKGNVKIKTGVKWNDFRSKNAGTFNKTNMPDKTTPEIRKLESQKYNDSKTQNIDIDPTSILPSPSSDSEEKK